MIHLKNIVKDKYTGVILKDYFSYRTVEAMNTLTIIILMLKINIVKCFKAGDNENPMHSASLTWGEYHVFSVLSGCSGVLEQS